MATMSPVMATKKVSLCPAQTDYPTTATKSAMTAPTTAGRPCNGTPPRERGGAATRGDQASKAGRRRG
ncbi:hypothetical protein V493_07563, partial [Pseudogymnoascus sp. VKM F-4281 (FW-2241)]